MQETVSDAKCDVYHTMAVLCGASHSRASVAWRTVVAYCVERHTSSIVVVRATISACCDIEHITDCPCRMSQGMRECDVYHIVCFVGCMSHMKLGVARITL